MQILKMAKDIDLTTIKTDKSGLMFNNKTGEEWKIPVDQDTMSFLIHFRCPTQSFNRISFSDVLNNNFSPNLVKDKIALIGFLSQTFGDIHNTSLRWLPGITLNANTFLTLYARDFIKKIPEYIELIILFLGALLSCFFTHYLKFKKAILMITVEIFIFFILSYFLLTNGYIWNYSTFPIIITLCPFLEKKFFKFFWHSKSILFTHKDTSVRDAFYRAFNGLKYKIITTYSNRDIFRLLRNSRPDYVVLDPADIDLPADQAEKEIKLIDRHITVITPRQKIDPQQFIHRILLEIETHNLLPPREKENTTAKQEPHGKTSEKQLSSIKKHLSKRKILIVEDENECAQLIKHYLSKKGYSIETALSGEEAIQIVNSKKPGIVILDIRMQGIDGMVVLKEIKKIDKSIIVIITSALENQAIIKEAMDLGANHYMVKPFSLSELEKVIHKLEYL